MINLCLLKYRGTFLHGFNLPIGHLPKTQSTPKSSPLHPIKIRLCWIHTIIIIHAIKVICFFNKSPMFFVDCKIIQKTKVSQDNATSFPPGPLPPSTGLGALAMADMAGKRPLCAMGPMMSALILCSFLIKEKGRKTLHLISTK